MNHFPSSFKGNNWQCQEKLSSRVAKFQEFLKVETSNLWECTKNLIKGWLLICKLDIFQYCMIKFNFPTLNIHGYAPEIFQSFAARLLSSGIANKQK